MELCWLLEGVQEAQTELLTVINPAIRAGSRLGSCPLDDHTVAAQYVLPSGDLYVAGGGVLEDSAAQSTVDSVSIHDIAKSA